MNDSMLEKTRMISLYGYYKNLLTEHQKKIFESYYLFDFSLGEIADSELVSRNAVWDTLKKVLKILEDYELKLCLYENSIKTHLLLDELNDHVDDVGKVILSKLKERE